MGGPWAPTLCLPLALRPQGSSGPLSGHRRALPTSARDPGSGPDCQAPASLFIVLGSLWKTGWEAKGAPKAEPLYSLT